MSERKIDTLIIDSVTGFLDKKYTKHLKTVGKANYDKWTDWGVEVLDLTHTITATYGWETVIVIGREGTGKSVAGRNLPPDRTVYFNLDSKPLHFVNDEGKVTSREYNKENKNYFEITDTSQLFATMDLIHKKRHRPRVFILGHVDTYRDKNDMQAHRLRILGNLAHKHNIEGCTNNCFYTEVRQHAEDDLNRFTFVTKNDGFNTARSLMGMFPKYIPNDFQLVNDILDGVKTKEDLPEGFDPE